MKRRIILMLFVTVLVLSSMLTGCGAKDSAKEKNPYVPTETDLSKITIGKFNWPVHKGIDYTKPYNKRFDGLEFTFIASDTGGNLPEGYTIEENSETWTLQGITGLKAKLLWSAAGSGYTQKMGQAITSGDIPDVMTVSLNQYRTLVKAGLIADLTDELLEGNHPTIQEMYANEDNIALESLRINGRIYGIPTVGADYDGTSYVWVRKDWLEKLNIEGPKSWRDLERVVTAFMEQDPDGNGKKDTYGLPILSQYGGKGENSLSELFLNVGGAAVTKWQKKEDGTLTYGSLDKGAKEALMLLNDWYKKGIIEEDFAAWDASSIEQVITNNQAGVMLSPWFAGAHGIYNSIALNSDAEWEAYMLPGEEGEQVYGTKGDYLLNVMVVSKDFEYPEAFVYAYDMLESFGNKYNQGAPDPTFRYDECEGYQRTNGSYKPIGSAVRADYYTGPVQAVYDYVGGESGLSTLGTKTMEQIVEEVDSTIKDFGTKTRTGQTTWLNLPILLADIKGENPRTIRIKDMGGNEQTEIWSYQYYLLYWEGPEAIVKAKPIGIRSEYMGTTEAQLMHGNFLGSYEQESYTKMIMGRTDGKSISKYFDDFVKSYLKQGGSEIIKQVNEDYKSIFK